MCVFLFFFFFFVKDGKAVWISATYNPVLDMDGKPIKVVKYATDVTDKHQLRDVETARNQMKAVLDSADDTIVEIDPSGTIIMCNVAMKRMFGYDQEFVVGKNVKILIPEGE